VGGDTDSVFVCGLQGLAKGYEGLNIATRADYLDDDVERRWCLLRYWSLSFKKEVMFWLYFVWWWGGF
jgi:hypothetical protein